MEVRNVNGKSYNDFIESLNAVNSSTQKQAADTQAKLELLKEEAENIFVFEDGQLVKTRRGGVSVPRFKFTYVVLHIGKVMAFLCALLEFAMEAMENKLEDLVKENLPDSERVQSKAGNIADKVVENAKATTEKPKTASGESKAKTSKSTAPSDKSAKDTKN